jgi:hypothetical protein
MAGPYIGTLYMKGVKSGRPYTLSIFSPASGAIGTYVLMDWNAPSSANSPNFWTVPELVNVTDFLPTGATGQVEFTSDGKRSQVILDYSVWQSANPQRPVGSLPQLGPGKMYRLLVVNTLAA